jgi:hypothetical protein
MKTLLFLSFIICIVFPIMGVNIETPSYRLLKAMDGYELREYGYNGTQYWAETVVQNSTYDVALNTGYERIFQFFNGANNVNQKIEMTAPVTLSQQENNFTIRFFIPLSLGNNIPQPNDPSITVVGLQLQRLAAIVFGLNSFFFQFELND